MDTGVTLVSVGLTVSVAVSLVTMSVDDSLLVTTAVAVLLDTMSVDDSLLVTTPGESLSVTLEGGTVLAGI